MASPRWLEWTIRGLLPLEYLSVSEALEKVAPYERASNMLQAWNAARGDKCLPDSRDLRPEMLRSVMSRSSLLEFVSADEVLIRIAPTFLENLAGELLRGQNFMERTPPELRQRRGSRIARVATEPCGLLARNMAAFPESDDVPFVILTLPVAKAGETDVMLMYSCVDWQGTYSEADMFHLTTLPVSEDVDFIRLSGD